MKLRLKRNKLMAEPPAMATGDIAFILIIFFLVCVSVQPDSGREQQIPRSESKEQKTEQSKNIEVAMTRDRATINGNPVPNEEFVGRLRTMLASKQRPEDRIVVVKSRQDTPYMWWIKVTGWIEEAGGIITLQLEEERTVVTP
ncbi:MAG: biopolymer transporter ExbD [Phycisphaera sp.]|nr:biopolymer transporter ExbD [Phycisphaera sp.]